MIKTLSGLFIPLFLAIILVALAFPITIVHMDSSASRRKITSNIVEDTVPFYVSWIIHVHQPIYNTNGTLPELLSSSQCPSWLPDVWRSRAEIYKNLIPSAALSMRGDEALQVDITGTLVQQLDELEGAQWDNCLYCGWKTKWIQAVSEKTSIGLPRLRIMGAGYYHPIFPLILRSGFKKDFIEQVEMHRRAIREAFGIDPGPGFFPIEESFIPEMIPLLVETGYKWTVVDSEQVLRATVGYSSGYQPQPNPNDVRNPDPKDWEWAISPQLAFRPHVVSYNGSSIVVFVRYRHMSQAEMSGTSIDYLISQIKHFQQYNIDPKRPFIMVIVHDGENGWPGHNNGLDYYVNYLGEFLDKIRSDPELSFIKVIGLDEYLAKVYDPRNDTGYRYSRIWVEPGSWETMGTWGDPEFAMWNYPRPDSPDQEKWGLYVEAVNYYQTLEATNDPSAAQILAESLKWILLGEASDYYYWDGDTWWDSKSTYSYTTSINIIREYMESTGVKDSAPPTLRYAWRDPYNPENTVAIYVQAYDINGIKDMKLYLYNGDKIVAGTSAEEIGINNMYKFTISLPEPGTYKAVIIATDTLGNTIRYKLVREFTTSGGQASPPPNTPFTMDGLPDMEQPLYVSENNTYVKHLWAQLTSDGILYVATEPPRHGIDIFIYIAVNISSDYTQAPWLKEGRVMKYDFYLGCEGENNWSGWFLPGDKQIPEHSGSAVGEVLEGWIDLKYYLGYAPQAVWVAVGAYETQDHGVLVEVLVNDDNNGNIDPEEFIDP